MGGLGREVQVDSLLGPSSKPSGAAPRASGELGGGVIVVAAVGKAVV